MRFTLEKRFDDFDKLHADLKEVDPGMCPWVWRCQRGLGRCAYIYLMPIYIHISMYDMYVFLVNAIIATP